MIVYRVHYSRKEGRFFRIVRAMNEAEAAQKLLLWVPKAKNIQAVDVAFQRTK